MGEINSLRIRLICYASNSYHCKFAAGMGFFFTLFCTVFYPQYEHPAKHLFSIIKLIDGLQDIFHNHSVNSVSIAFPRMEIYERHQNTNQILRFGPKELQTFKAINSTPDNFFSLFPLEFLVAFAERCIYESCTNIIHLGQCGGITELCFKFNN